jgi:hypothetical protein
MAKNSTDDLDVAGRLADGWAYAVTLKNGTTRRLHATQNMASLLGSPQPFLVFDGARADLEAPRDGAGFVRTEEIALVCYWGPVMDAIFALESGADIVGPEGDGDDFGPDEPGPEPEEPAPPPAKNKAALDRAMSG